MTRRLAYYCQQEINKERTVDITNAEVIGENSMGYRFTIGQLSDGSWIGFAASDYGAFFFPEIATGHQMGVADRDTAIGLTIAKAQDEESGYGGIETWHIPENQRVALSMPSDEDEYFEDED